jgi:hypothetical protein
MTFFPVRAEPVKAILPISGCNDIAAPIVSGPVMQLTTPGGSTSFMISIMRKVGSGA